MSALDSHLESLLHREVVLDTECEFVYAGRLSGVTDQVFVLEHADVHDLRDSATNRERYLLEVRQHGIRANRQQVVVSRRQVVSLSALEDVIL